MRTFIISTALGEFHKNNRTLPKWQMHHRLRIMQRRKEEANG